MQSLGVIGVGAGGGGQAMVGRVAKAPLEGVQIDRYRRVDMCVLRGGGGNGGGVTEGVILLRLTTALHTINMSPKQFL